QQQDDFELAAFEFCVTYEAAPSPWTPAICRLRHPESAAASRASSAQAAVTRATGWQGVALSGELQGDAVPGLPALDDVGQQTKALFISCSELIRVDFSAAGSILNWVAQGQSLGCQIEFRDVPFLVAAFFNLIGINQHAQVLTRVHQESS
ncbi:MAG: STAS domain-containing protein, partial [Rhodoferax sp.]|nr:STAS domain-containing protein [Rhodoferax sp.]